MSNGPNPSIALPKAFDEAEYINVRARAEFFGYATPTALAILPANFNSANSKEALLNQSSAATLRKLWKQAGVTMTPLEKPDERIPEIQQNAFRLIMPIIFIGYSVWSQNPTAVSLALSVAANYITDFFKGIGGSKKVKLEIVIEKQQGKEYRKLSFEGPPEELPDLAKLVSKFNQ